MQVNVSIIIAVFNGEKYLPECLDSIIKQKYHNFETIIIDGGSTDQTVSIIKDYSNRLLIQWISEKDNGIYDAWNKAISMSQGTWLTFVGCDDVMFEDWLQIMLRSTDANPTLNFVSAITTMVSNDLKPIRNWGSRWNLSKMNRYMNVAHVGAFHHRTLFDRFGTFNISYKKVADYEFLLRIGNSISASFVNEVIGLMRHGGASDTVDALKEALIVKKKVAKINNLLALLQYCWAVMAFYKRKVMNR
ncbi:glycosyltransferase involved in cell wall biosynthesis [Breznakibacter xylanolyticus]|uniref:Glycosyltransferase involved in cell wall biosynthesis n=1 Tax=Breznakibacter xylanolyticus TaxID=990 RepID=A0A2W7NFJ8_9BACT|nr:glycosyltransferase family 2 protein [Breznakibacter xylanolyticus]PZX19161.1 glycosyltransferase involved in cell wall biosynthesis [Breznakibacter xylanolyticus]